jgi:AcrR family transcriptional regulator
MCDDTGEITMSDKNIGNPRSEQSKLWMEEALLKLMVTENYNDITIQEITDHAGLSRRSFYRNYSSKDEILIGCFYKIWLEYRAQIEKESDLSLPGIAKIFFTEMEKHTDFLTLVNRQHLLPLLLGKVNQLLPQTFYEVKGDKLSVSKKSIEYALTFSTGGFMHILVHWLNDNAEKSPEEMADILRDFIFLCNFQG